ncbi:HlyD family secretion protein [Bradyrhizobium sp. CCBAU 53338]|uniref:HlyD family secretion protein n=1 Tax=Bradyrhizobium sp. CCBAU 53338 TaxID=1325111 RepID=UPI00188AEF5B|nr:biotin/lipoyl-binding protein [Bradyrhizobium sp. CCBAU 53338]QOZ51601.1 hypothetical protein XH90_09545 [Bradyrhizobium sp. CCBAU 53338]
MSLTAAAAMYPTSLFREEAIQFQRNKMHGSIILRQSWRTKWFAAASASFIAFAIAFVTSASVARKQKLDGLVLPEQGLLYISAPTAAVVVDRRVVEGQEVRRGDVLFVLSAERTTRRGGAQESITRTLSDRVESLTAELELVRLRGERRLATLARRRQNLLSRQSGLEKQIQLQVDRAGLAEEALRRSKTLYESSNAPLAQVQEKTSAMLEQKQKVYDLLQIRDGLLAELENVESDIEIAPIQTKQEIAALHRAIGDTENSLAVSEIDRQILLQASGPGVVSSLAVQSGQQIKPGDALAAIEPANSTLFAVFYVPSGAVGLLHPKIPVRLSFDAYPSDKYGTVLGSIEDISRSPALPMETANAARAVDADTQAYRVRVAINAASMPTIMKLKPGMRVRATALLDYRRLFEWLYQPLVKTYGREA